MQPQPLPFTAIPGTVLLCDTVGAAAGAPRNKNGVWGCYTGVGVSEKLVEASDLITFAADPKDKLFPTKVTFCSDVDMLSDPGDNNPACKGANLLTTGNFALLERGTEQTGPEITPYAPAGMGSPGYGTIAGGTMTFLADYRLISDQKVPEPASFGLCALGLIATAWARLRLRRTSER